MNPGVYGFPPGRSKVGTWAVDTFLASGLWTPPPDMEGDVVFLTGAAGGGGNTVSNYDNGGGGGQCCSLLPVKIKAGEAVQVTIGAAGTAAGGSTSFGSYLTLLGGASAVASYGGLGGGQTCTSSPRNSSGKAGFGYRRGHNSTGSTDASLPGAGLTEFAIRPIGVFSGGSGGDGGDGTHQAGCGGGSLARGGHATRSTSLPGAGGGSLTAGAPTKTSAKGYGAGAGGDTSANRTGAPGVLLIAYPRKQEVA